MRGTAPATRVVGALLVGALLVAGTPVPAPVAATAPAATAVDTLPAQVFTDVAYTDPVPASTRGNLLDLYLPERTAGQDVPLFIFSEGSGWRGDNGKSSAGIWAARLNPFGYAVAGVSVRTSAQAIFPGQLHDLKAAIRFLRARAATYDLAPQRFAVGGFSSGGWAAALAGVTNDVGSDLEGTEGVTGVSSRVQAVVTFAAPTTLRLMDAQATPYSEEVHNVPGSAESEMTGCTHYATGIGDPACTNADRADPVRYVSADDPPFLIFHTSHDESVPFGQSQVLFDALAAVCVSAEYHYVEGPRHLYDPYLANPGEPPVTGQTLQRARPKACDTTKDSVITEANQPSYALVAAFLDRTIGPEAAPDPVRTTVTLAAAPARQVFRAVGKKRLRLVATVSRRRLVEGARVRFVEAGDVLGSARIRASGKASLRLPRRTPVGRHRVRAVFRGNDAALASRSERVRVRVVRRG